MKKLLTLALAFITLALIRTEMIAQTQSIILNTGYDQANSIRIAVGQQDNEWRVIVDPTHQPPPPPATGRPADVVNDNVRVSFNRALPTNFPNSRWISFAPNAGLGSSIVASYKYAFYFTLPVGVSSPQLTMKLSADDHITEVKLNNCLPLFTGSGGISANNPPLMLSSRLTCFNSGPTANVLTVTVENTVAGTITGLIVEGTVASARPTTHRPENFYVIKERRDAQFAALRRVLGDRFLREEGTGFSMYQQWVGYWQQKLYPHGDFAIAHNAMANIVREPHPPVASPQSASCSGWTELGPLDMPLGTSMQRGVGQVGWIAFDPANANNVFTGSPKGGLFYSTDAGAAWQSGGTDFLLPNIGAAHLAVDPTDGNRWFLATGDGRGLNDSAWNTSHGVWRTPDKGLSWEKIGLDLSQAWNLSPTPWIYQIKKLVIAPTNPQVIFAATSFGLYRTDNALDLAGSVTWTLQPTGGIAFYDIEYQPGSTSTIYASGDSLVRSQDGGVTWSPLPVIPFLGPDVIRMAMAVTPANPDYLYVVVVAKQPAACNGMSIPSSRLYRFDASSQAWTDKGPICNTGSYATDQRGVHYSRADSISISPVDANLIYIADVKPVVKCTTGGDGNFCNWQGTTNSVHDDIAKVAFSPDGLTIYAASDGGVFKTVDGGAIWTAQNNGLRVATSLRMSTSATDPSLILNGLFDDGTVLYQNSTWQHVLGGDGLTPIIDHIDPNHMYASSQGGGMVRSDNMGNTFSAYVGLPCPNWYTYAVLNSSNPATIFGACHPEVLRSTARGANWVAISQFALQGMGNYEVWKIYTAPSDPDTVYAHLVTGTPQLLMRTTNANDPNPANVTWQAIGHPSAQWISDIDVDEADPNKFWLTYGGFVPTEKIYYYDGNNWQNLTTNLTSSNMSVSSVVHERGSDRLFIGTHLGVYSGNGALPNWTRVGTATAGELPYVEVPDLEINYVNNKLRASTFGRGTWEIALDPCLPTVAGPDAIIKDSVADVGNQPNNDSGFALWASDDIWVRNTPDHIFTYTPIPPRYSHEHQHENPEFSAIPINTPYIYAKVRNRGNQPVSGKVHFYWANASTGLDWQSPDWTEIIPTSSTTDVVSLAPGGVWVARLQWTNIPVPQLSTGGHFCLVARFVADNSTPDPIVGEVTGNGIWGNVYNSNNIAWKNVTIVNNLQNLAGGGGGGGQFIVRNISPTVSQTRLRFDLASGSESFLRSDAIEVDLGRKLFALWQRGGERGGGVRAIGPTTIAIREPRAYIDNLMMSPREEHVVTVRFSFAAASSLATTLRPAGPRQREFTLQVMQLNLAKGSNLASQITGGETFLIRPTPPRPRQSEICVLQFVDRNGNRAQDTGEPELPGWTFQIKNASGNIVATITTGGPKTPCADVPALGTYTISEVLQPGWTPTTSNPQTVTVSPGQTVKLSFGNKLTLPPRQRSSLR